MLVNSEELCQLCQLSADASAKLCASTLSTLRRTRGGGFAGRPRAQYERCGMRAPRRPDRRAARRAICLAADDGDRCSAPTSYRGPKSYRALTPHEVGAEHRSPSSAANVYGCLCPLCDPAASALASAALWAAASASYCARVSACASPEPPPPWSSAVVTEQSAGQAACDLSSRRGVLRTRRRIVDTIDGHSLLQNSPTQRARN